MKSRPPGPPLPSVDGRKRGEVVFKQLNWQENKK
jgi:hypothetical protein